MAAAEEIRNIQEKTTGDFFDFEVLHDGAWKRVQLAGTAIRLLNTGGQSDRQAFDANAEKIIAAAQKLAIATPANEKIKVSSFDM
jgi:hypothetical protein